MVREMLPTKQAEGRTDKKEKAQAREEGKQAFQGPWGSADYFQGYTDICISAETFTNFVCFRIAADTISIMIKINDIHTNIKKSLGY